MTKEKNAISIIKQRPFAIPFIYNSFLPLLLSEKMLNICYLICEKMLESMWKEEKSKEKLPIVYKYNAM